MWQDSDCYWCLLFPQCFIPALWNIPGFAELKLFFYAPLCRCWNGHTSWEQHYPFPLQPLHFWAMVSKLLLNCMWAMGRHLPTTLPTSVWLCTLVTCLEPSDALERRTTSYTHLLKDWGPAGHSWRSCHVHALPSRGPCCSCFAVDEVALLPQGLDLVWVVWDHASHCHTWCTSTPPLSKRK